MARKRNLKLAPTNKQFPVTADIQLTAEDTTHVGLDLNAGQMVVRESVTYLKDSFRRLRKNRAAMIGLFAILFITFMSLAGPYMTEYTYNNNDLMAANKGPGFDGHMFGTDMLGRDLWARVWMGGRNSLFIGLVAGLLQMVIGITVGSIAGMKGGKVDLVVMRFVDILNSIPSLIFVILITVVIGSGMFPLILAFAITGWLGMARMVRAQIMELREQEYVLAATTLGASKVRLLVRHMLPNIMSLLIVQLTLAIPAAIFYEAFLAFLGIGLQPPKTSWGQLAKTGGEVLRAYPYQLIFPGTAISLAMLSLNLLGDGLRDSFDPRMRK